MAIKTNSQSVLTGLFVDGNFIRDVDGQQHDFSPFKHLTDVLPLVFAFCISAQSTNDKALSRSRTNLNICKTMLHFMRFVLGKYHGSPRLDLALYTAYENYNRSKHSPSTAHSNVSMVRRLFKHAMDTGSLATFRLPPNLDQYAALSVSDGATTLADCVASLPIGFASRGELNVELLSQLRQFCWERIQQVTERMQQALRWQEEIAEDYASKLPRNANELGREEILRHLVCHLWSAYDGYMPRVQGKRARLNAADLPAQRIRQRLTFFINKHVNFISLRELSDYMKPSSDQISCFLPLFALEGINPFAIYELETSMMVAAPHSDKRMIVWDKRRAKRELTAGPWTCGSNSSATIPQAWDKLGREPINGIHESRIG